MAFSISVNMSLFKPTVSTETMRPGSYLTEYVEKWIHASLPRFPKSDTSPCLYLFPRFFW